MNKLKCLISLAIATAVGSQAFAMQITKGKLINHQEWKTGNVIASYLPGTGNKESSPSHPTLTPKMKQTPSVVVANTSPMTASVGSPISVSNESYSYIWNDTQETRTYFYRSSICVETIKLNTIECVYSDDTVELEPNGIFSSSIQPTLTLTFDNPGLYDVYADSNFYAMGQADSSLAHSSATINVS